MWYLSEFFKIQWKSYINIRLKGVCTFLDTQPYSKLALGYHEKNVATKIKKRSLIYIEKMFPRIVLNQTNVEPCYYTRYKTNKITTWLSRTDYKKFT